MKDVPIDMLSLSLSIYKQVEQEAGHYPFDEEDAEDFINLPDGDLL